MDLKIKDVADLLNISKEDVHFLMKEEFLPYYKLKDECMFNVLEIENWMGQKKNFTKNLRPKIGLQVFNLYRAVYRGGVFRDVEGETKEEVIKASVKLLEKKLNLDVEIVIDLLMDRERLMSTGLGDGIAIPHTRDYLIKEAFDVVAVVYPKNPIEYDSLDGKKVHTLFFLFACDDKRHLNILAKIAHFAKIQGSLEFLRKKPEEKVVLSYLKEWEENLQKK